MSALTVAMLWITITSALCLVWKVIVCMGHYYYVRVTACPVQIRAHHHIDVYTDINELGANTKTTMKTNTVTIITALHTVLSHRYR